MVHKFKYKLNIFNLNLNCGTTHAIRTTCDESTANHDGRSSTALADWSQPKADHWQSGGGVASIAILITNSDKVW